MSLIQIDGVSMGYGSPLRPVLDNIDISIEEGEFVCLLGQTGCGKSTLLRLVLGCVCFSRLIGCHTCFPRASRRSPKGLRPPLPPRTPW